MKRRQPVRPTEALLRMEAALERAAARLERLADRSASGDPERVPSPAHIGTRSTLRPALEFNDQQDAPGVALALLLSIPGFAHEATRVPVSHLEGGTVTCVCQGRTQLHLGRLVRCEGGCGRWFTREGFNAFAFGPWEVKGQKDSD